jgi:glycosyltransferase involved in cell wall biosynthesis
VAIPNSPLQIAFCVTDLDPGGAEKAMVQLVTRLDRSRWQPAVFCLAGEGALADELRAAGVSVTCLGAKRWTDLGVVFRLAAALRTIRPAILQTFLFHANIVGRIAGRLAGIDKVISGIRVAERRSKIPLLLDQWTNRLVHTNVCVSRAVAEYSVLQAGLSPRKTIVIPNGVDVSRFADAVPANLSPFGIPPGSRVFLTIGRLDRQKGLTTLIESAALVLPNHPQVRFLLVGEGPQRGNLEELIRAKGLADRVHLGGWRVEVPELLAAGFALILPSLWEGMPNVVLEAMAAGLPVVASRVEGIDELVIDGQTGVVVSPHSHEELAAAIESLLADPMAAQAMGRAGHDRAQVEFTWEKMVRAYEGVYYSIL